MKLKAIKYFLLAPYKDVSLERTLQEIVALTGENLVRRVQIFDTQFRVEYALSYCKVSVTDVDESVRT